MLNNFKFILVITLILLLAACSVVRSVNPLGMEPYSINKKEWEGTWIKEDKALQLKVIDDRSSEIEIMFIEKGKLKKYQIFLAQNGKDTYMNLLLKDDKGYYYPVKFKKRKNQLIIWVVSAEMLKKSIDSKKLEGEITKHEYTDDVLIKGNKEKVNLYFSENNNQMLFNYEEPLVLRRLVK